MKKLKSSGYNGGNVKTSAKEEINKIEKQIQNDLSNFYNLIKNRYINNDLTQQDINIYLLCLQEFIKTGKSNTGITTNFGLQYMISHIEKSLEARVLKRKHLYQQIDYFTDLLKIDQNPINKKRTKPTKGKVLSENYNEGNVKKSTNYSKSKPQKITEDLNFFLENINLSYFKNKYKKSDLECYVDCLRYLKENKSYPSTPNNPTLKKTLNFTKIIYENKELNETHLNHQIEGIIKILSTVTPNPIEPKRTKPTKGKVSTLSKGYKK